MKIREYISRGNGLFLLFIVIAFFMAYAPIKALNDPSNPREYYSHIPLIPLVSIYLVYQKRKAIFSDANMDSRTDCHGDDSPRNDCWQAILTPQYITAIPLLLIGGFLYFLGYNIGNEFNQNDIASIMLLSTVLFLNGAFILSYGIKSFKASLFPLLFLMFMIPIPSLVMDNIIYVLQVGSTEFTNVLLTLSGVPFLRDGFVFHLPSISVEVAKQCSGIRSSLALVITALLAGHLFLNTWWKKVIFAVVAIPIAMFKNGIRIVTLTLLGAYVDPRILESSIHRDGGIPFFVVALLLMAPILYFLRKNEVQGPRSEVKG